MEQCLPCKRPVVDESPLCFQRMVSTIKCSSANVHNAPDGVIHGGQARAGKVHVQQGSGHRDGERSGRSEASSDRKSCHVYRYCHATDGGGRGGKQRP